MPATDQGLEWLRLYRSGITGARIAGMLPDADPLEVLRFLAAAKREDPSLAAEHAANLPQHAVKGLSALTVDRSSPS